MYNLLCAENLVFMGVSYHLDASSNPLKISPPRDLTLSPTPPPSQGGKEAGNDLSVVMPETPEAERVPGHAFMQTSLGRTPGL